jgi:hypothetical protein
MDRLLSWLRDLGVLGLWGLWWIWRGLSWPFRARQVPGHRRTWPTKLVGLVGLLLLVALLGVGREAYRGYALTQRLGTVAARSVGRTADEVTRRAEGEVLRAGFRILPDRPCTIEASFSTLEQVPLCVIDVDFWYSADLFGLGALPIHVQKQVEQVVVPKPKPKPGEDASLD